MMVRREPLVTPAVSDLSIPSCPAHPGGGQPPPPPHTHRPLSPCSLRPGGYRGLLVGGGRRCPLTPPHRTSAATPPHLAAPPRPAGPHLPVHLGGRGPSPRAHLAAAGGGPPPGREERRVGAAPPLAGAGRAGAARRGEAARWGGRPAAWPRSGCCCCWRWGTPGPTGRSRRTATGGCPPAADPRAPASVPCLPAPPPPPPRPPPVRPLLFRFFTLFLNNPAPPRALQGGVLREQNRHHPLPLPEAHGRADHLLQVSVAAGEKGGGHPRRVGVWVRGAAGHTRGRGSGLAARGESVATLPPLQPPPPTPGAGGECGGGGGHTRVGVRRGDGSGGICLPPPCPVLTHPGISTAPRTGKADNLVTSLWCSASPLASPAVAPAKGFSKVAASVTSKGIAGEGACGFDSHVLAVSHRYSERGFL